jgi:pyridinium-3,5-biscarboxylic acid mononucleotide synthase
MIEHGIRMDDRREARLGFDEAIYSAGKSTEQLDVLIADSLASGGRRLFTRLGAAQWAALAPAHREACDYERISRTAIVGRMHPDVRHHGVAVLTAGSSDMPVAGEAMRTLEYHGHGCTHVPDVGVAGLWRLMERLDELRSMPVLIVVAGMEGALVSVVGGLLPGAVIALPTSVGYGVSHGGQVALNSALASCAPGILTVNIDNGYGAACAALRILRQRDR